MSDAPRDAEARIGYFLVRDDDRLGCVGGLLVVTVDGRPLEFHCTEPIRTNRAQEILYGPTLRAYVVGDRIGGALLRQCAAGVDLLLATDADEASAATRAGLPSAIVADASSIEAIASGFEPPLAEAVRRLAAAVDLAEPFDRIRAAIDEAQRIQDAGGPDVAAA